MRLRAYFCAAALALGGCTVSTLPDGPAQVSAMPVGDILGQPSTAGRPSEAMVAAVTDEFRAAMRRGGMIANTEGIGDCFQQAMAMDDHPGLLRCELWDATAMAMDRGYRNRIASGTGHEPGPTLPFLARRAFQARAEIVARRVFGGNYQAVGGYIGDAPAEVLRRLAA